MDNKENSLYSVSKVKCNNCSHTWIAVRPEDTLTENLQCPRCKNQGFVIETQEEIV